MGTKVRKSPITRAFRSFFSCPRLLQFVPLPVLLDKGCKGKPALDKGSGDFVPMKGEGTNFVPGGDKTGTKHGYGDKWGQI